MVLLWYWTKNSSQQRHFIDDDDPITRFSFRTCFIPIAWANKSSQKTLVFKINWHGGVPYLSSFALGSGDSIADARPLKKLAPTTKERNLMLFTSCRSRSRVFDVDVENSSIVLSSIVEVCWSGLWTSRSPSLVSSFFHLLSRTRTRKQGYMQ